MALMFLNAEKAFNLSIDKRRVVVIYASINIKEQIEDLLLGKSKLSQGEIIINASEKGSCRKNIGFLFLEHGLYERLTVEEMLVFMKRMFSSTQSIDVAITALQLETVRKERIKRLSFSEKKRVQFACSFKTLLFMC